MATGNNRKRGPPGACTRPVSQDTFAVAVAGEKSSNALDHVQQNLGSVNSGASAANADEVQSLKRALKEEIASRKAKIEDLEARLMAVTGGDADGK